MCVFVRACVRACKRECVNVRSNVCSVATVCKLLNTSGIHLRRLTELLPELQQCYGFTY